MWKKWYCKLKKKKNKIAQSLKGLKNQVNFPESIKA